MAVDDLMMLGARASAAIVLTHFSWHIPALATERSMFILLINFILIYFFGVLVFIFVILFADYMIVYCAS